MQFILQRLVSVTVLLAVASHAVGSDYHVGIGEVSCIQPLVCLLSRVISLSIGCCSGKADITGPAADVNMMVSCERFESDVSWNLLVGS